uniref:CBM21 domain-containing protein n=1 Tax=Poecilia reticulata TaxID=8081 RepID=A0A3P9P7Y4_POERE
MIFTHCSCLICTNKTCLQVITFPPPPIFLGMISLLVRTSRAVYNFVQLHFLETICQSVIKDLSRRVSFADAKGLSLVQVKEFDTWDVPKLPGSNSVVVQGKDSVEYHLLPQTFSLPLPSEEVLAKVLSQKVELETIGLLPGTTILKGVVRVLNISYNKSVYVRTSLDRWATHFDLLAEYVPGSSDGVMDSFSFKLTLGPPFGDQGVRVDFCLRYETPMGTFWANNNNRNYVLSCQRGMKVGTEKPQREKATKKSCLKTVSNLGLLW